MDTSYIAYYLRRLYFDVYFSTQNDQKNLSIINSYFSLYKKVLNSKNLNIEKDDESFLCDFIDDLEGFRFNIDIAEKTGTLEYNDALSTFKSLQIKIRQLDVIMECEKDLDCISNKCQEKLLQIQNLEFRTYQIAEEILDRTYKTLLQKCTHKDTIDTKTSWQITNNISQEILNNTFQYVIDNIEALELPKDFLEVSKKNSNTTIFINIKDTVIKNLSSVFNNLLTSNERKWRMLKKNNYLSFMLDDNIEKVKLITSGEEVYIFYDLYVAVNKAMTTDLFVKYFKNIASKSEMEISLSSINHNHGPFWFYSLFFLCQKLHIIRKDFNHLSTILIGIELGFDSNRIEKLANEISNISRGTKKNIKNKNIKTNYEKVLNVFKLHAMIEKKIINFTHDKYGKDIIYT